jgi:hypothetical protein
MLSFLACFRPNPNLKPSRKLFLRERRGLTQEIPNAFQVFMKARIVNDVRHGNGVVGFVRTHYGTSEGSNAVMSSTGFAE